MATYSSVHYRRGRSQRRGETRRPGQWKLAYADFLTALMAFFLLMWLSTEQSVSNRSALAAYFSGEPVSAADPAIPNAQAELMQAMMSDVALTGLSGHVEIVPTPTGLRIDLADAQGSPLFASGSSDLNDDGNRLVGLLGGHLALIPGSISVEGHSDAFPAGGHAGDNWSISAMRANAARKGLETAGVPSERFASVVGFADSRPALPNQPHAAANRRISILLELRA